MTHFRLPFRWCIIEGCISLHINHLKQGKSIIFTELSHFGVPKVVRVCRVVNSRYIVVSSNAYHKSVLIVMNLAVSVQPVYGVTIRIVESCLVQWNCIRWYQKSELSDSLILFIVSLVTSDAKHAISEIPLQISELSRSYHCSRLTEPWISSRTSILLLTTVYISVKQASESEEPARVRKPCHQHQESLFSTHRVV